MRSPRGRGAAAAWFLWRGVRMRLRQGRAVPVGEVVRSGADPLEVRLIGAGLAAAYGVETHEAGLAGALADDLASRTRRGVAVRLQVCAATTARALARRLRRAGPTPCDLLVCSPCYLEESVRPGAGMRRHGCEVAQQLLRVGGAVAQVVLVGMPRPSTFSRLDLLAAEAADETNRTMRAVAEQDDRLTFVTPPPIGSVQDPVLFDEEYYRRLGGLITAAVAERLN